MTFSHMLKGTSVLGGKEHCELEMWAMPNVTAALPNIGGALCWTPQS